MDLPANSWQQLALQIPLALVIVVLTIYFLRHLKDSTKDMLAFMEKQLDLNRQFLDTQQVQNREAIGRLAEEIKNNKTETIREVANLTARVDGVIDKAIILERLLPENRNRNQ